MQKIIVIVGPTSSGKTSLSIDLAEKFNGEIISCDSRQIYKRMDLGTGKIEGNWESTEKRPYAFSEKVFSYKNIPHYCIDYVDPKKQYSVCSKASFESLLENKTL